MISSTHTINQWTFVCTAWLFCAIQFPAGICLLLCAYLLYKKESTFDKTIWTLFFLICLSVSSAVVGQIHQSLSLVFINIPLLQNFFGTNFATTTLVGGLIIQSISVIGFLCSVFGMIFLIVKRKIEK